MIVKKSWWSYKNYRRNKRWTGWFLLGFIPLYIKMDGEYV